LQSSDDMQRPKYINQLNEYSNQINNQRLNMKYRLGFGSLE
jgi:hypothetical protein